MLPSTPYLLGRAGGPKFNLDSATTAWVNAVNTNAGFPVVSVAQQTRVDNLIKGLKADGNWTLLDRLWLWGGESQSTEILIDIVNLVAGTTVGGFTLSTAGLTGNGTNAYFDTNTNLGTLGGNFSTNSASVGVYIINNRTTGQNYRACGVDVSGIDHFTNITPYWSDTNTYWEINDDGGGSPVVGGAGTARGQWILSRTASGARELRRNGAAFASDSLASSTVLNADFVFFARRQTVVSPATKEFSADTQAAGFLGGGLTSAQSDQVASRINAYMTAWGINVY